MRYTSLTEERFTISAEPWGHNPKFPVIECWLRARAEPDRQDRDEGARGAPVHFRVFYEIAEVQMFTPTNGMDEGQVKDVALKAALRYLKGELDKPYGERCLDEKGFPKDLLSDSESHALSQGNVPAVEDDTDVLRKRRVFLRFRILQEIEARSLRRQAPAGPRSLWDSEYVWAEEDEVGEQVEALGEGRLIRLESCRFLLTPEGERNLKQWRHEEPWCPKLDKGPIGFK